MSGSASLVQTTTGTRRSLGSALIRRQRSKPLSPGRWRSLGRRRTRPSVSRSQAALGVGGDLDLEARLLQDVGELLGLGRAVLDDEHAEHEPHSREISDEGHGDTARSGVDGGRTDLASPAAMAAPGMPKTTEVVSSWAMTRPPAASHGPEPDDAVLAHAGQDHGDGRRAEVAGDRLEQEGPRGTEAADRGRRWRDQDALAVTEVAVVGGEIDRPRGQQRVFPGHA